MGVETVDVSRGSRVWRNGLSMILIVELRFWVQSGIFRLIYGVLEMILMMMMIMIMMVFFFEVFFVGRFYFIFFQVFQEGVLVLFLLQGLGNRVFEWLVICLRLCGELVVVWVLEQVCFLGLDEMLRFFSIRFRVGVFR